MPNIRISNVDETTIKNLSKDLSSKLSMIFDCEIDWITFSVGDTVIYCNGEDLIDTVFVHIEWFNRGEEIKKSVASLITKTILEVDEKIKFVTVMYVDINKSDYYENGESFE